MILPWKSPWKYIMKISPWIYHENIAMNISWKYRHKLYDNGIALDGDNKKKELLRQTRRRNCCIKNGIVLLTTETRNCSRQQCQEWYYSIWWWIVLDDVLMSIELVVDWACDSFCHWHRCGRWWYWQADDVTDDVVVLMCSCSPVATTNGSF